MAEGNYPFPSTYITYALEGGPNSPLPSWPMRVACKGLTQDFGVHFAGSARDVNYTLTLGDVKVSVDWATAVGTGPDLTEEQIKQSRILRFASAVAEAAGVWYNVTKDKTCWDVSGVTSSESTLDQKAEYVQSDLQDHPSKSSTSCPACPPCSNCPPCPVSRC